MRKIGGLAVIAAIALAGCSAPAAPAEPTAETASTRWITKSGESFDITSVKFQDAAIPAFAAEAAKIPGYSKTSPEDLAVIGRDLCEHYAGGFTTEDLQASGGASLAAIGEAAKVTVCAK
jgi:hypothetical protein